MSDLFTRIESLIAKHHEWERLHLATRMQTEQVPRTVLVNVDDLMSFSPQRKREGSHVCTRISTDATSFERHAFN
jgi:hypothetical protein